MKKFTSHYDWLDINLPKFLVNLGIDEEEAIFESRGLIRAHGDKCYSYRQQFATAGLKFEHGIAIYLLTYLNPWTKEVRETSDGWVKPIDWILTNKDKFMNYLPETGDNT